MPRLISLGLLTLLLLPACDKAQDPPPPPTIVDKSAEDAADLTAEITCDYVARCGIVEVTCADCAEGQDCGGCTTEVHEVSPDECMEELVPDLEVGFGCEALTAEEQALVDECLAALPQAECPSIEVVHDDDVGEQEPPDDLAACEVLGEIMERCYEYGQSEEPGGEPGPAEPLPG